MNEPVELTEVSISKRLGLPQWHLRNLRAKLPEGSYGKRGAGRNCRVWYREPAIKAVEELLKVTLLPAPIVKGEQMQVFRSNFANTRVIQCQRENGEKVLVRVRDSTKYKPRLWNGKPMLIHAIPDGALWTALGRAPRHTGKW